MPEVQRRPHKRLKSLTLERKPCHRADEPRTPTGVDHASKRRPVMIRGMPVLSSSASLSILLSAVVVGGISASWMAVVVGRARHERAVLRAQARASRARGAALEAAEEDPLFSPEEVKRSVAEVVVFGQALWRTAEVSGLEERLDAHLIRAWARSRESWLGGALRVVGQPSVDLLQVVNRGGETEDRVIVRVRLKVRWRNPTRWTEDIVGNLAARHHAHLDERWTLGRRENRWMLLSVDGDPLAGPVLSAPLVPTRSHDVKRLQEESLAELASSEKVAKDVNLSDLVAADEPPALALLDLSTVDGRFLPALIAAELAHLIEVWEEATTGSEAPLGNLASHEATAALLHPAGDKRLIMRDAELKSWEPTRLDLSRRPAAVEVALTVDAIRYVVTVDRDYVVGNADQPHHMALTWLLELTDSAQAPWRLARSNNPAEQIPGWS
jgi:hypothetical protein